MTQQKSHNVNAFYHTQLWHTSNTRNFHAVQVLGTWHSCMCRHWMPSQKLMKSFPQHKKTLPHNIQLVTHDNSESSHACAAMYFLLSRWPSQSGPTATPGVCETLLTCIRGYTHGTVTTLNSWLLVIYFVRIYSYLSHFRQILFLSMLYVRVM